MIYFLLSIIIVLGVVLKILYGKYRGLTISFEKVKGESTLVRSFLQEISSAFIEAMDLEGLLQSAINSAVRILKAKSGAIFLLDETKKNLKASNVSGNFPPWDKPDPSVVEKILSKSKYLEEYILNQKISLGSGIIGSVAETKSPCLISNAEMDSRIPKSKETIFEINTMMLVPLKVKDNVLGVLVLVNKENKEPFTETDLELLKAIGDQASIAIRNASFYSTILEKQKLDNDLNIASDIQHMLLPSACPDLENWDISVLSKPAMAIGGDYYDFIDIGKNKLGVVIADVSGKSIPGALVMSMTRTMLRSKAIGFRSASSVLMSVNELICQDIEPDMFISLLYLILDTKRNTVTYARAGHEPLIKYNAEDAKCETIKPDGMVLGIDDGPLFNNSLCEVNIKMLPGDIIVLYTDGITESINDKKEEFGIDDLMEAISISSQNDANAIVKNISDRIDRFTAGIPQQDDLTLVVLKLKK